MQQTISILDVPVLSTLQNRFFRLIPQQNTPCYIQQTLFVMLLLLFLLQNRCFSC